MKFAQKFIGLLLALALIIAQVLIPMPMEASAATAVPAASTLTPADTDIQNGVTLHCWNWSYKNILANLPTIAASGYTAIQVSPIQQAKQPTMGGPVNDWWAFYQPADFEIDNTGVNAMGTKAEFMNLCETAHEYGIYVIVDVVANHMAADNGYSRNPAIPDDIRNDNSCWHNKNSNIYNYSSRENITQYDLDTVLDLNTGSKKIQNYVLNYLKELIDAGADGFRFDAVKHIETPDDSSNIASDFWPTVIYGAEDYAESKGLDLYCYGELLDHPDDVNGLPDSAYAKYYSITDNVWGNNVRDAVVGSGNASNFGATYHKNVSANQLVLWAESHDTFAGGTSKGVSTANINKTWALVAARADTMSLYLARTAGFTPPYTLGEVYDNSWSNAEVAAVNKFHDAFVGQSEYVANSGSIAYVERGTSGVILVNVSGNGTSVSVPANKMANGTYKDQITGNTFKVSGGKITGNIGSTGIAVVYNVSSCSHANHEIAGICSNCLATVNHSYVSGVCACGATKPVTGSCAHGSHRYNGVCRGCGTTVSHSYSNGICSICGVEQPVDPFDYYLYGFINGTNVNDANNAYKFVNGKLTVTTTQDWYVAVRTYNGVYYQTSSEYQNSNTAILRNASMSSNNSTMKIPGGQTVTLSLYSNFDGTYTLTYGEGSSSVSGQKTKIYFDNSTSGWSKVNAYSWTGSIPYTGTWPGSAMTKVSGNIYSIEVPVEATSIIFNDGSSQTSDLSIPTDGKNLYNGTTWSVYSADNSDDDTTTSVDYYLIGYINGANYGCEEDHANLGKYKFVDGTLTATFDTDSYVFVKTGDNANWYLTESYCTDTTGTFVIGGTEKMLVPGGVELTFTLSKNANGSLTMSYTTGTASCVHSYTSKVTTAATCTTAGIQTYTCSKCGDSYTESIAATGHSYVGGICTVCGASDPNASVPTTDYYLIGYINGANYGCEEDWENLGQYKFVNGSLTATFEKDSYVFVKTGDNKTWYMCEGYVADATTRTLYNADTLSNPDKIFVPGGIQITFTLESYGSRLVLSYTAATTPSTIPTLTLNYPSLSFEDEIRYNVYYAIDDTSSVVEMGLVTFNSKLTGGTISDATDVIPGYANSGSTYMTHSNGIPAKNLSDALYFKVYAKLTDGTYVYSDIAGYHAVAYANTILNNAGSTANAKALVVAMLNYGAAAQEYFGYKTDALMNASLTSAQQALVKSYDESMVSDVVKADASKVGSFVMNGGYSNIYPTVSFEGAFSINYYFTPSKTVDAAPVMYYWDSYTYNNVSTLTAQNATGTITMTQDGSNWGAAVEGIAAKNIDETIYVAAIYTSNGVSYPTGIIAYSLGKYCETIAANGEAFGAATAVYGYYAKAYFA